MMTTYMYTIQRKSVMNNRSIYLLLMVLLALASCREDNPPLPTVAWSITMDDNVVECYERYYSLYTIQSGDADTTLVLSTTADWLTLMADTLPDDGILQIHTEANTEVKGRTADILVTSVTNPEHSALLTIYQRGLGDYDDNSTDTDPLSDYRVGWGFNAFEEYKSLNSLRGKVIDPALLAAFDSDTTFHSLQEVVRGREEFNIYTSHSLQEMSSVLTKTMTSETSFLGVKKTIHRYSMICTNDVKEQACAYARLQKTVATRSIDAGALLYIVGLNDGITTERLPFTDEFRAKYDDIIQTENPSQRDDLIKEMIDTFGTHLIVEASVGCMLDLVLTFDKQSSYDFEKTAEETCKKIFGRSSSSQSSSTTEHTTCTINNSNAFQIKGGSAESKQNIEEAINEMTTANQLSSDIVMNWLSGVSFSSLHNEEERKNLDVVDFRFIPIWKLFSDNSVQARMQEYVMNMSERSDCAFTDNELSTDNYAIDLTRHDMQFKDSHLSETSLVKILYINNNPIIEICEEYVPKIRSDRRITVFYPIFNGRTRIGQGLFPGDGEGNPPAALTFSEGDVYVDPIDGYSCYDKIETAYYMHGSLYVSNYGIPCNHYDSFVEDYYLSLFKKMYPVVKIGSGYWTRCYIKEKMGWLALVDNGGWEKAEALVNNVLFACIHYGRHENNGIENVFSYEEFNDDLWSLPRSTDINYLVNYLDNNLKLLFKGQCSGFNAEFLGAYDCDFYNRWIFDPSYDEHVYTETSWIPYNDSNYYPKYFLINANYNNLSASPKEDVFFVPLKLFRTSQYKYK